MLMTKTMLVTGGAGFIGSNFIRFVLKKTGFKGRVINLDKLTYAGLRENLHDIELRFGGKRYFFIKGDICDSKKVNIIIKKYAVSVIVNFAAETHVDRSIHGPKDFIETNINGVFNLLECARANWKDRKDVRFHHISTDEVFGSLVKTGRFTETTPYDPRSPYSASKAASDHLVRAYFHTYGLPVTISNCSNNYGPYQHPEKLIPLALFKAVAGEGIPVYGDGGNTRDWLFVEDHCRAVWLIINKGKAGKTYNVGGNCEKKNLETIKALCLALEKIRPRAKNPALKGRRYEDLITFVKDRPGHDRRYAIDSGKIKKALGWKPLFGFNKGLEATVAWYLVYSAHLKKTVDASYRAWLKKNYTER
ncbi:MAG: dTDP-glucose 4,6-dehydratase [Elusimicrobia bacterium GWC2_51_8]|nr:MAG: dTDP-glucose 4,6-dehydratase [Elusimicrobia bacterium GWA2_51_34]OGR64960.1 MAG: dTDP-glucose 4,6-dehydratase [Elusimicrobia bacterium GWC2_51_8]OGR85276.1 MAG: dTDP-glucose 4,6-dehydratase [Elusimicrobia bacterium GWF2_52_66]HAF95784.1 dTDP-glucose 4,6-dehydratase [Elusimicrobiota bacterium]HCE99170.1 dTDP-glucose 4,6-dehydratase [Elusimicrobiota bacterium]